MVAYLYAMENRLKAMIMEVIELRYIITTKLSDDEASDRLSNEGGPE